MSPQIATVSPSSVALCAPDRERVEQRLRGVLVRAVARVDDRARRRASARNAARPPLAWRTTITSGCIASRFFAVSSSVSPLVTLDEPSR